MVFALALHEVEHRLEPWWKLVVFLFEVFSCDLYVAGLLTVLHSRSVLL